MGAKRRVRQAPQPVERTLQLTDLQIRSLNQARAVLAGADRDLGIVVAGVLAAHDIASAGVQIKHLVGNQLTVVLPPGR